MATQPIAVRLEELLDERVHLMIRVNLIENGKPDPLGAMSFLKRKLVSIEDEIESSRRSIAMGWRANALVTGPMK